MTAATRSRAPSLARMRPTWVSRSLRPPRGDPRSRRWCSRTRPVAILRVPARSRSTRAWRLQPAAGRRMPRRRAASRPVPGAHRPLPRCGSATSSAAGAFFSRKPLAPARRPRRYSSRSNVVSMMTRVRPAVCMSPSRRRVAVNPSTFGIRTSISTTSGRTTGTSCTASPPSPASPTTSRSSSDSMIAAGLGGPSPRRRPGRRACESRARNRHRGFDHETPVGPPRGFELAAEPLRTLAHARQPEP